jgi:hypothetical protein
MPRGYKKNGRLAIANQPIVIDYLLLMRTIAGSFWPLATPLSA